MQTETSPVIVLSKGIRQTDVFPLIQIPSLNEVEVNEEVGEKADESPRKKAQQQYPPIITDLSNND